MKFTDNQLAILLDAGRALYPGVDDAAICAFIADFMYSPIDGLTARAQTAENRRDAAQLCTALRRIAGCISRD